MSEICLIVPCYNEEKRLNQEAFASFLNNNHNYRILFVNDGSTDGTARLLDEFSKPIPSAEAFHLNTNGGKAEAVRHGILHAQANPNYEFIGFLDADLATPLDEVLTFEKALRANANYQMALGSRWKRLGARIERKISRHYLGRIFATVTSLLFDFDIYDTQCGAKLMRNKNLDSIFSKPFISPWFFDIEVICRYQKINGATPIDDWALEIPLTEWREIGGSRIKVWDFLKAPLALLQIRRHYRT